MNLHLSFSRRVSSLTFVAAALSAVFAFNASSLRADDPAPDSSNAKSESAEEIKLPDIGIRMTPDILNAMSMRFAEAMQTQLELNNDQKADIEKVIATNLGKLTRDNAENGRTVIESLMATMIRNDGRFPKEDAVKFAKQVKPLIPAIRQYFTDVAVGVGPKLNIKQRLEFSAQMGVLTAGLGVFEKRMSRWEEGKVGENANPFWDPSEKDPEKTDEANADPNENPEHRKARQDVERWIEGELRIDEDWEDYLKRATEYYGFDEAQKTSCQNILKQCKDKAALIKTPEWHEKVKGNRIAKRLARRAGGKMSEGPIVFVLDREYNRMRKPLVDLDEEFKRRIEEVPTSKQRAEARQKVRKFFTDRGMKEPPL